MKLRALYLIPLAAAAIMLSPAPRLGVIGIPTTGDGDGGGAAAYQVGRIEGLALYTYTMPRVDDDGRVIDKERLITALEFAIALHQQNLPRVKDRWWDSYWIQVYEDTIRALRR